MCQMRKINQVSAVQGSDNPNEIFDKYQSEFGYLLNPKAGGHGPSGSGGFYLPDGGIRKQLRGILFPMNSITMLVGGKGRGKTSAIKDAFGCETSQIKVLDSYMLVPMFYRRWITDKATDSETAKEFIFKGLVKTVKAACEEFADACPALGGWIRTDEGQNSLLNMIKWTNPRASVDYNTKDVSEDLNARLDAAYRDEPLIYMASLLKLCLSSPLTPVHRLLLVVDDVESIKREYFADSMAQILRLFECMANLPGNWPGENEYINLLFALRPESYQHLKELDVLSSYSGITVIKKWKDFDLLEYFTRKLEVLPAETRNSPDFKWDEAMTILRNLCTKYDGKYCGMIMGLAQQDVRLALEICRRILSSTWTAMDPFSENADRGQWYGFNNISIIRSISCGDRLVYMPDEDSIIPNVLENTEKEDNSVIALYVMSYFAPKDEAQRRRDPITEDKRRFMRQLGDVFGETPEEGRDSGIPGEAPSAGDGQESGRCPGRSFAKRLESTIDRLREQGILLEENGFMLLTMKGRELWNMLQADSVLSEVFREDRYRDASDKESSSLKSSSELTSDGNQTILFHELINDLRTCYWEEEQKYINAAVERGSLRKYADLFGSTTMTGLLLKGIKCSIDFSGRYAEREVYENWRSLYNEINGLTKLQPLAQ